MLSNGWEMKTIDELKAKTGNGIAIGPFGSRMKSDCYVPYGIPVIRGNNISDTRDLIGEMVFITPEKAKELKTSIVYPEDLFFPHRGSIGQVGIVPFSDNEKYVLSSSLMKITCDRKQVEPLYLFYFFRSEIGRFELLKNASTVGTPGIGQPLATLKSIKILLPPLQEQREIIKVLGSLDDKIELNRRMNATLEAMARALFQSWFLEVEPVRKKVKELEKDGVLEIGDGYRAKNNEFGEVGLPFIRAANLKVQIETQNAERLLPESVAKAGNKISRFGDVAFTSKGTIGRFARVSEKTEAFVYSPQVCFWRSLEPHLLHPVILYCWMLTDDFLDQVNSVSGQTDMAPYVSLRDQREMTIPIFPSSQNEIGKVLEKILAKQSSNESESKTLLTLRDSLLPKLINGEISVASEEVKRAVNA